MPISNLSTDTTVATSDRELVFTRLFDAPRELVFEAWTDPKHLPHWWGPNGFTTTVHELDLRTGGTWRLTMRGPDGRDYKNRLVFLEVVRPERLVYKHVPEPGSEPATHESTVTFTARGKQTEVTMRMLFTSGTEREHIATKYGAIEGGKQTLGRLAGYLPAMTVPELVLTRVFDAPRDLVFKAWTERDRLQRWWGPKDFTNPVCEVDARPGGSMRIHMRAPDGAIYPMTGVFLELVEPERLVFVSGALDHNGNKMFEVLTTVIFEDHGKKTKLTLNARVIMATAQAAPHLAGMRQGWASSLDRLAAEVA